MIKLFSTLLTALVLLLLSLFQGSTVHVNADFPASVEPGNEYTVQITIHKGDIGGFSRLQYFLPPGFSAEALETAGGQFIDEESSVKFIWIQLPADDTFRVSMKIKVAADVNGLQAVNGLYTFIENNKTQKLALPVVEIPVGTASANTDAPAPEISRKLIAVNPQAGEYRVELNFHRTDKPLPARFIDNIPTGFNAEVIESKGAAFTFENQKAVFEWAQLPVDSSFTISYRVNSTFDRSTPSIDGMLVYGEDLDSSDDLKPGGYLPDDLTAPSADNTGGVTENDAAASTASADKGSANPDNAMQAAVSIPAPQQGIYYKVQICATIKSPVRDTEWFHHRYKIQDNVDLTYHEGWKKYLIGTFESYGDAKACRSKTTDKVPDAFVVAYDNGQRIGLQEALKKKALNQ